jgi:putative ABC transport system substrate-binding protein
MHTGESLSYKKITSAIAATALLAVPIWIWVAAPQLTKLTKDLSYKADLFSLDNFYDEQKQEFSGEKRSVTKFSYEVVEQKQDIFIVKNVFDVRTVTGDKIFAVERLYGIDQKTGKHVMGFGDKNRDGYLFAPRHLKYGEPFTYWHINYDGPAHMVFAGEENLFGLPVYRYETRYEGIKIDQTANLGFLPDVGKTRGVELEPYLQLWIEPISGHMVKYKDDTIAYYYDLKTGTRQNPWNHFGNTYTRDSVLKHAELAKSEKVKKTLVEIVIPAFLTLLALALVIARYRRKAAVIVFALGLFGLGAFLFARLYTPPGTETIKIGIARWVENPLHERNIEGFKDALKNAGFIEGKNVVFITPDASEADAEKHKQLVQSLVDQKVQLIYSLTTPGTLVAKSVTVDTPIIFSIVTYPVEAGLIVSLKGSGNNLVGTTNWVPPEEQLVNFLEIAPAVRSIGFVHRKDEPNSTIQFDEMKRVAATRGIEVVEIAPNNPSEINLLLESSRSRIDSLYSACDTLIQGQQLEDTVIAFAKKYKLPDFACVESGVRKGSLVGTVADLYEIGKLAGEKAAFILEGATAQSLETNTVARPFIYVNQATANNLGLAIPQTLILKAKEIINE